jgi:hypothetical protein
MTRYQIKDVSEHPSNYFEGRTFSCEAGAFAAIRLEIDSEFIKDFEVFPISAAPVFETPATGNVLPQEDLVRKAAPMYRGLIGYFPRALFRVAAHSFRSDRKHNPDKPESEAPHWRRDASSDHLDCIVRHLAEMHEDPDYHLAAIAWRALAALQEHEEKKGAAPGSRSVFP